MSHTCAHNLVHCVFSTKDRLNLIRKPEELWRYVVGLAHARGIHVVAAGGTANRLHLLILLPQTERWRPGTLVSHIACREFWSGAMANGNSPSFTGRCRREAGRLSVEVVSKSPPCGRNSLAQREALGLLCY